MKMSREFLDFRAINSAGLANSHWVLPRLLPDGKRLGNEWVARNPTRADKNLGSFRINLRSGRWADFATGDRGGDLISLVAYIQQVPQVTAAHMLEAVLGGCNYGT
jgi:hypothetical protein